MTKKTFARAAGAAFALLLSVISLAPFLYVFVLSFFTETGVSLQPYYDVFWATPQYTLRFWRSLGMCMAVCLGQLFVSILAGFAFAKCRFKGRDTLFYLLLILMVLPIQVTLVPNYLVLDSFHLLNTYAALILPSIFVPLGTFILRQSFASIPDAVVDAAMIDGCSVAQLIARIAVPMNWSGVVCVLLLSFLDAWNMVEQPIAYLKDMHRYPISVALAYVPPVDATVQLVCCILVVLPCLFFFTFFNRELVEGITLAEIK